ncbi:MAG: fused MFS/spermidine synthase [Planctomycetota bacterium]
MRVYYSLCLLLSASLLMLVQPMAARMLLPYLGGSPGVWNACMVFFQAGLLAGYAYAHLGPRWLGVRLHAFCHLLAMIGALALLPIAIRDPEIAPASPALWTLQPLATALAVPYVLLASTSSLAQIWFARSTGEDPYSLYAASNLGSFLGLFAYPLLVEPYWTRAQQAALWRDGFAALVAMLAVAAVLAVRKRETLVPVKESASPRPAGRQVVRWILLALAPSSLLLSVTNHVTTDLASAPLLWVVPFGLYLLTFVLVFARRPLVSHAVIVRYVPIAILFLLFLWFNEATSPLMIIVALHLLGFTWLALFCHGELAATRPAADRLAAFYFWIALGGALGGVCNVLLAPLVLDSYAEYPLMIVAVGALRPFTARSKGASASIEWLAAVALGLGCLAMVLLGRFLEFPAGLFFLVIVLIPLLASLALQRPGPYALALLLILATGAVYPSMHGDTLERRRSFFGVHRVAQQDGLIELIHGSTIHGQQSLREPLEPLAYYHRGSPIASVIERLNAAGRLQNVGVIGLGSGALAAYAQKGQSWTFFEIDPDVQSLAESCFSYLAKSQGNVRIVLGDARLSLARSTETFDLLIIDAFGSDSIPTHLLTREAMAIYAARLKPGGMMAVHVSNRYLDLFPILAAMTTDGWHAWRSDPDGWPVSADDAKAGRLASWWGLLARDAADVKEAIGNRRWRPLAPTPGVRAWTDDYINLPSVVRWKDLFVDPE